MEPPAGWPAIRRDRHWGWVHYQRDPGLVREVERYTVVGLTSTHSTGSGTKLLERGWTLCFSGVAPGERCPRLNTAVLEFSLENETGLWVAERKTLTVVCTYAPNSSSQYPTFSESLSGVLDRILSKDSIAVKKTFHSFSCKITSHVIKCSCLIGGTPGN